MSYGAHTDSGSRTEHDHGVGDATSPDVLVEVPGGCERTIQNGDDAP